MENCSKRDRGYVCGVRFSGIYCSNRLQRQKEIDHTHVVGIRHLRCGSTEPQQCQVPCAVPAFRGYRAWSRRGRACRDLRELHATFINIQELEARTREYNSTTEYVKSMQLPQVVWVRENLSILSERDFTEVVPWLVEEIDALASSHSSPL